MWKLVVLVLVLAVACGSAVAQEPVVETKVATETPRFESDAIVRLVQTYLKINSTLDICIGDGTVKPSGLSSEARQVLLDKAQAARLERFFAFEASYQGDGSWIVTGDWCSFVVDDRTGKVTGP